MKARRMVATATLFLTAWLHGCATTGGGSDGQNPLQQAMAREATLAGSRHTVSAEDRFFTATVAASAAPAVAQHEGFYQLTVPIGGEIPAECLLYRDALDSATTLRNLINELLDGFSTTRIAKIDAGTFGPLPYVYLESLYLTDQKAAGVLKGIVVPVGDSTLACLHDEPGYSRTFVDMVGGLAGSLRIGDAESEAWKFQEILVWRLNDMNVGFTVNRVAHPDEGEIRSVVETAVVLPRSVEETLTLDGYDVVFETEDGELVAGMYAEATSGELTLSVNIEKTAQHSYTVSGEFQGKAVNTRLEPDAALVGPYRQYVDLVRAAHPGDGKPRPISVDAYVPSANPLDTLAVEAQPTGQRVEDLPEYDMLFGGLKATSLIDSRGAKSLTVRMGSLEMQLSRAWIEGQI